MDIVYVYDVRIQASQRLYEASRREARAEAVPVEKTGRATLSRLPTGSSFEPFGADGASGTPSRPRLYAIQLSQPREAASSPISCIIFPVEVFLRSTGFICNNLGIPIHT